MAGIVLAPDAEGRWIGIAFAAFLAAVGCYRLWRARRVHPESVVYAMPGTAPAALQVKYYSRLILAALAAFPVLTLLTAWELYRLESGQAGEVSVWAPLAWLYERAGFWPTVASLPALGLACIAVLRYKVRELARSQGGVEASGAPSAPPG